jgi:hypothetical protein
LLFYLAVARLLHRGRGERIRPAEAAAMLARTAESETGMLARYGHSMTWAPGSEGSRAGACGRCGGVCTVTLTDITYNPPLAADEQMLACAGGTP